MGGGVGGSRSMIGGVLALLAMFGYNVLRKRELDDATVALSTLPAATDTVCMQVSLAD